jgi:hypothetical protein
MCNQLMAVIEPSLDDCSNSSRVFRTRSQNVVAWAAAAVIVVAGFGECVAVSADGHAIPGVPLIIVVTLPFLAVCVRGGMTGVWANARGVKIVNLRRTIDLDWDEVSRFSLGRVGLLPKAGIAEVRDGSRIGIWAIQGPNPATRPNHRSAELLIDALNDKLDAHRRARPAS